MYCVEKKKEEYIFLKIIMNTKNIFEDSQHEKKVKVRKSFSLTIFSLCQNHTILLSTSAEFQSKGNVKIGARIGQGRNYSRSSG